MGVFSKITQTLRRLMTEQLLKVLRVLSGNGEERPENRFDAPVSTDRPGDEMSNTTPMEENSKRRLSSNRLGGHGSR